MMFECIKAGKDMIDITFSCQEQIARLPNKTFKWIHEVDGMIGDLDTFEVKTLVLSLPFQQKAKETFSYWAYSCEVGMKDRVGLRCYIKATKNSPSSKIKWNK